MKYSIQVCLFTLTSSAYFDNITLTDLFSWQRMLFYMRQAKVM